MNRKEFFDQLIATARAVARAPEIKGVVFAVIDGVDDVEISVSNELFLKQFGDTVDSAVQQPQLKTILLMREIDGVGFTTHVGDTAENRHRFLDFEARSTADEIAAIAKAAGETT